MSLTLWKIELIRPGDLSLRAFDFLTDLAFDGQTSASAHRLGDPDTGDWRLNWIVSDKPDTAELAAFIAVNAVLEGLENDPGLTIKAHDVTLEEIDAEGWLARSYRGFPPFSIGRFFLYGHHHTDLAPPEGQIPLMIDAVTAFGSGEHPTTKGCLLLLDELQRQGVPPSRILDHGTGSGILAIAAWKLWGRPVVAADIDPESVKVAREYASYNGIADGDNGIAVFESSTPAIPEIETRGPYDLVIANILAGPLRELAPDMASVCAPHATLILSGLLDRQMDEVIAAYTPFGFRLDEAKIITDWAAIRLVR